MSFLTWHYFIGLSPALRQAELKIEEIQKKDKWLEKSKEDVSDKAANVM